MVWKDGCQRKRAPSPVRQEDNAVCTLRLKVFISLVKENKRQGGVGCHRHCKAIVSGNGRRNASRIELLERRDVIGEWLVGLAGVGLAATAQSPPGDDAPIAFGSYSTAQLGGLVNRGLASILAGYAATQCHDGPRCFGVCTGELTGDQRDHMGRQLPLGFPSRVDPCGHNAVRTR